MNDTTKAIQQLRSRMSQGDRSALREFYREYGKALERVVRRAVRDQHQEGMVAKLMEREAARPAADGVFASHDDRFVERVVRRVTGVLLRPGPTNTFGSLMASLVEFASPRHQTLAGAAPTRTPTDTRRLWSWRCS